MVRVTGEKSRLQASSKYDLGALRALTNEAEGKGIVVELQQVSGLGPGYTDTPTDVVEGIRVGWLPRNVRHRAEQLLQHLDNRRPTHASLPGCSCHVFTMQGSRTRYRHLEGRRHSCRHRPREAGLHLAARFVMPCDSRFSCATFPAMLCASVTAPKLLHVSNTIHEFADNSSHPGVTEKLTCRVFFGGFCKVCHCFHPRFTHVIHLQFYDCEELFTLCLEASIATVSACKGECDSTHTCKFFALSCAPCPQLLSLQRPQVSASTTRITSA